MGEKTQNALKLHFDRQLRLEFRGARIISDAGLLAYRELDGALGLTETAPIYLRETRGDRNVQHELVPLLRQSVYTRLAGYGDINDALRLARDPAMQAVVGHRALEMLEPIVARYESAGMRLYFRADAAFARPKLYCYLEGHGFLYAIRLPANDVLEEEIRHLLKRPVGRPSKKPIISYHDFQYQASSWDISRRVVPKVKWHPGELFPRVGFIVTNLSVKPEGAVRFYNRRSTAEQWIKEGKHALNWTRLSCHRFISNQVRLQLFILAYNLGNFLRRLCLPKAIKDWSLRSLQLKLIKMGGADCAPCPQDYLPAS